MGSYLSEYELKNSIIFSGKSYIATRYIINKEICNKIAYGLLGF